MVTVPPGYVGEDANDLSVYPPTGERTWQAVIVHRPNVLLITLDQFRGDALSTMGHPVVRTPHLDELARHGVHFRRHYTQSTP